jgi:hypothetical protein
VARRYTRIFGRDAAICVMAMCGSGVPALEQGAVASLDALAAQQAANGQIPKYVDPEGQDADFWYLGCIDATLWWLIAVDHVRRHGKVGPAHWAKTGRARRSAGCWRRSTSTFRLLQQNEASDWADIMPRSGYVLYTNALWYDVKRRFALEHAEATQHHFNHLFNPVPARPARVPPRAPAAALRAARPARPGLYLSFVNLAVVGDEGDVFGNVLAIQGGLADTEMAHRIVQTIDAARASDPTRCAWCCIRCRSSTSCGAPTWAPPAEHRAPVPQRRHLAVRRRLLGDGAGEAGAARAGVAELARLAQANALDDWRFTEWFHGRRWRRWAWPGRAGMPRRPSCWRGGRCCTADRNCDG